MSVGGTEATANMHPVCFELKRRQKMFTSCPWRRQTRNVLKAFVVQSADGMRFRGCRRGYPASRSFDDAARHKPDTVTHLGAAPLVWCFLHQTASRKAVRCCTKAQSASGSIVRFLHLCQHLLRLCVFKDEVGHFSTRWAWATWLKSKIWFSTFVFFC